jgi:hypothetical protein
MSEPPRPSRLRVLSTRFSEVDEFIAELTADRELVEREIVRVTELARPVMHGALTRVWVHAGAIVDGRPVTLQIYVGDLWASAQDDDVQAEAAGLVDRLDAAIRGLGLEPRAGQLQEIAS